MVSTMFWDILYPILLVEKEKNLSYMQKQKFNKSGYLVVFLCPYIKGGDYYGNL
jgi:hypothetical protein